MNHRSLIMLHSSSPLSLYLYPSVPKSLWNNSRMIYLYFCIANRATKGRNAEKPHPGRCPQCKNWLIHTEINLLQIQSQTKLLHSNMHFKTFSQRISCLHHAHITPTSCVDLDCVFRMRIPIILSNSLTYQFMSRARKCSITDVQKSLVITSRLLFFIQEFVMGRRAACVLGRCAVTGRRTTSQTAASAPNAQRRLGGIDLPMADHEIGRIAVLHCLENRASLQ